MKNFFKVLGIIALVAVIGFSMAACDSGGGGGSSGGGSSNTYWVKGFTITTSELDTVYKSNGLSNGIYYLALINQSPTTFEKRKKIYQDAYAKKTGADIVDGHGKTGQEVQDILVSAGLTDEYAKTKLYFTNGLNVATSFVDEKGNLFVWFADSSNTTYTVYYVEKE